MKKAIFYVVPLALMAFVFVLISPISVGAVASPVAPTVVCPAGYVCTPIASQPVLCPTGYICTPINPVNNGGGSSLGGNGGSSSPISSCYTFNTNLTIGSTGADVVALQTLLIANGYSIPDISSGLASKGYYGQSTAAAVSAFQVAKGIANPGVGFVGPLTRAALNKLSCTNNSTTNPQSSITVLSPNGGQSYQNGNILPIKWSSQNLGTSKVNIELWSLGSSAITATIATNIDNVGSYNWSIPNSIKSYSGYFIIIRTVDSNLGSIREVGGRSNGLFSITSPTTQPSAQVTINSVTLQNALEDKVGLWGNFGFGAGNANKNPNDWHWYVNMTVPQGASKYIKRITIKHNTVGEVWSTGYSRYLGDGTDLYGREEHPYPLVVTQFGTQMNKSYDQSLHEKPFLPGTYELKLYGQPESTTFTGGKLIVEFTDGTSVSATIPASSMRQSQAVASPSITVLSPNGGESFLQGSNLNGSFTTSNIAQGTFCEVAIVGRKSDGNPVDVTIATPKTLATDKQVYSGRVSADLVPVGSYKIRVDCGGERLLAQGQSDNSFTITSPTTLTDTGLTVLTPMNPKNNTDVFYVGENLPVTWSSKYSGVNRIYLLSENGSKVATILATNDNGVFPYTGSTYSWKIPDNIPTGTYKVRVIIGIEGMSTSPVGDSGTFKIRNTSTVATQPSITVLSPNGGERLEIGKTYDIRWANYSGNEPLNIVLQSTSPDNKISTKIIASNVLPTGSYKWFVAQESANSKYKIEVYPSGGRELVGRSKDYFFIISSPTPNLTP